MEFLRKIIGIRKGIFDWLAVIHISVHIGVSAVLVPKVYIRRHRIGGSQRLENIDLKPAIGVLI